MKEQTEHPSNKSYIEIGFDPNRIRNVPLEKYEKDFTLIVNGQHYKMSRIVADLLSPEIIRLHFIDDTINEFSISTSTDDEEIENQKQKRNDIETEGTYRKSNIKEEEREIIKEIIETVVKGSILRIEKKQEQDQEQKCLKEKENAQLSWRKRIFVHKILRELGNEEYFKFYYDFSSKITKDNVIERIRSKIQENKSTNQDTDIKEKRIMEEEINFISKHFYEMIKEGTKTRESMKELEVEIIKMIVENENLLLENEESLLEFVNELYKGNRAYSILYEYVEFWNILRKNNKFESNKNDSDNITIANKDKNKAKNEMRIFFEIFDINDLNIGIWNQIFSKFIFIDQTSNFFSNFSTNRKEVDKEREIINNNTNKVLERYHKQKPCIIEIGETNELNGIMRYLTNETKGNIHNNGTINITTNSTKNVWGGCYHQRYLVDFNEEGFYASNNEENTFICFDFKDKQIEISKYQIKSFKLNANSFHLKNWKLEISNDGNKWEEIDQRSDCGTLNGNKIIGTFKIENEKKFGRFVRLVQTGKNWRDDYSIFIYNIEFYGKIKLPKK